MARRESPSSSARPRRAWHVVAIVISALLVVGGGVAGWYAWSTRPQGEPQAVEMEKASVSDELAGATLLALGEATHGNAEFQRLRLQLVQKLPGFRAIVFEEDYGSVAQVNEYVQGGPGTAEEAARRFGFVLNHTAETAELLQWIRDHNADVPGDEQIELVGMDVQRVDANKEIALSWLESRDPALAASLTDDLAEWTDASSFADGVGAQRKAAHPLVEQLVAAITDASEPGDHVVRNAARALQQNLDLNAASDSEYGSLRAEIMATNLERTVAEQAARGNGHTLLFAHNGHVDKQSAAFSYDDVGTLAERRWGDAYRVIGTEFHHNTLLTGQRANRWNVVIDNPTPLRGLFAGTRVGWLEFSAASGANRMLLEQPVLMGSAGEGFQQWQAYVPWLNAVSMTPAHSYDVLVLVENATPVTPLK